MAKHTTAKDKIAESAAKNIEMQQRLLALMSAASQGGSIIDKSKQLRLMKWLQDNRSASPDSRLIIAKEELQDLSQEQLLHMAANWFTALDAMLLTISEVPSIEKTVMDTCKILGDQLEAKNTAAMRPHAKRGEKVINAASAGGEARASRYKEQWPEWQQMANDIYAKRTNPKLTFADIKRRVAAHFGRSERTIDRRVKDPAKKVGQCPPMS